MRPFRNGSDNSRSRSYLPNDAPLLQNELQNLDMELQILKRQREIIFKQRQVENQLFSQRLNSFDQPSTSTFSLEPKQNYDTSYSDDSRRNRSNLKAHKRPSERSFDNPGPKQLRSNSWGDRHDYNQARKPQPLMKIPVQQPKKAPKPFPNNKPSEGFVGPHGNNVRLQRDFQPSQAKAKVKKIDEKSIPTFKNTFEPKKKTYSSDDFLRPNVVPSPSVNGRLELALGELLKRIKTSPQLNEDQKRQLTSLDMRCIKAILRQRISSVMMNKQVRSMAETVAEYKKTYRKDIDNEILAAIEKTHNIPIDTKGDKIKIKNISATETAKIHKFFKSKINMVLKNKVQNMIDNFLKIYGDNEEKILECIKDLPKLGEEKKEIEKQSKDGETNVEIVENSCNEVNNCNTKEHIEESDKKIEENNPGDMEVIENKSNSDNTQENITESPEKTANNNADKTINLTNSENDEAKKATIEAHKKQAEINERRAKLKQYFKLMDLLIENRLPKLLLKFKDEFAKMLYCEKDFIIGKEMIMMELKETLRKSLYAANNIDKGVVKDAVDNDIEATVEAEVSSLNQEPEIVLVNKDTENNKDAQKKIGVEVKVKSDQQINIQDVVKPAYNVAQKGSQLYVMLLGRPSLPSKADIYDFLNKFNPKSIKKHKTVNNLLVVGFENKDDYDNILEANETKVGNATFIIKANEVIASDKQKEKTTTNKIINKANEEKLDEKNVVENVSQTTEEIIKVAVEQVVEKNTNETKIDDARESDETIQDKIGNNEKQVEENKEGTIEKMEVETSKEVNESDDINKVEVIDVNDEVTDITDKSNGEKVFLDKNINNESNSAKESTANDTEENIKTGDVIVTDDGTENKDTEKVSNLEVIQGSEEDVVNKFDNNKEVNVTTEDAKVMNDVTENKNIEKVSNLEEIQGSGEDVVNKVDDNKEVNVKTDDAKVTNDVTQNKDTELDGKLEAIPESEEGTVKPKTRAAAVATPTRSSSRIANTPSSIRTRRASRLGQ